MKTKSLFFLAPDDAPAGGSSPAPTPAVPAQSSPTGAPIPSVQPNKPSAPQVVQPSPERESKSRVLSARKALGLAEVPKKQIEAMQKRLKSQVDETDTPVTRIEPEPPKTPVTAPKPSAAQPAEPKATTQPAPEEQPETPATKEPQQPQKITVAGKEYTPQELEEHLKVLEAKAKLPEEKKPQESAKPQAQAKTPEEHEAEQKQLDEKFITDAVTAFKPQDYGLALTAESLDTILAGGEEGLKLFSDTIARVAAIAQLEARKFAAEGLNRLHGELSPVLQSQAQVAQYQSEANFLSKFPDIAHHPSGQITAREVNTALHRRYDQAQRLVAVNAASPEDMEFIKAFESETAEQFEADIAHHTRRRLGLDGTAPAPQQQVQQQQPEVQKAPAKPKPTPPPPTGQVGGVPSPQAVNPQRSMVADLVAHGY